MYNEALENLENDYFDWLYNIVDDSDYKYENLVNHIFGIDFDEKTTILIDKDHNRIADAYELREDFIKEQLSREDEDIICIFRDRPCSVLEVLIALAYRMEDVMVINRFPIWFWEMLSNLGLESYDDDNFTRNDIRNVDRIINRWLDHNYEYNGEGGLFPLNDPPKDQRTEEIWYQMSAYLVENYA